MSTPSPAVPPDDATLESHGGWPALLTELVEHRDLTAGQARAAMQTILAGDATAAQLIGFVVALRSKGETPEEVAGLLDAVLAAAEVVPLSEHQLADFEQPFEHFDVPQMPGRIPRNWGENTRVMANAP